MHLMHQSNHISEARMQNLPDISLLQSFAVVAEELNFRRSAERLALDQSALSRRIQKLEAQLGYPLFERSTREVTLTPAGQSFFRSVSNLLYDCSNSILEARRIAEGQTGQVRVGYMAFAATELLPQTVARFRKRHPDVALELKYIRTQGQKVALANDEIDVGFLIGPFDNSEYHSVLLASDLLYLVMPKGHSLLKKAEIAPDDILEQDLIIGDMAQWGEYRYRLDDLFNPLGITLTPSLEAANTLALIGLVAAGLGVTIYPESLIGFLGQNVDVRPIVHKNFRIRTLLVWKRTNRARNTLNFVETAKDRF
ncbi:LysR family transcriptional regulator [Roseovarius sp. TM1035]|nr:LysR family transcriptional regulator [Roseovarius sp. TM1035]